MECDSHTFCGSITSAWAERDNEKVLTIQRTIAVSTLRRNCSKGIEKEIALYQVIVTLGESTAEGRKHPTATKKSSGELEAMSIEDYRR